MRGKDMLWYHNRRAINSTSICLCRYPKFVGATVGSVAMKVVILTLALFLTAQSAFACNDIMYKVSP